MSGDAGRATYGGRTLERDWTDALNEGLTDVQGPASDRVRVDFAFYGSIWRPDRRAIAGDDTERGDGPARGEEADSTEGLPPSPFMSELTREILATQRGAPEPERLDFRRLVDLVGALSKYYLTGEFQRAIALADRVIEEHPTSGEVRRFRAMSTYTSGGDLAHARVDLEEAARTMRRSPFVLAHLAMVLSLEGKQAEARRLADELIERAAKEAVPPITVAIAQQALGNYDAAFEWFERAYQARDFLMIWLHVGPMFRIVPPTQSRPITDDPRWTALVQRVGLAP